MASRLWLTWEIQRRNRTLSKKLDAELHELISKKKGLLRYCELIFRSYRLLIKQRPQLLFVQNPSLVLALWAVLNRPFFSYRLIVDAHNAGLYPAEGKSPWLSRVANFILRNADLTMVTNQPLASEVIKRGGRPFVLPDPLPELPASRKPDQPAKTNFALTCICTWAEDEPIKDVIDAVREFNDEVTLYITGRPPAWAQSMSRPEQVVLTGFLKEEAYLDLLGTSDALMVLTTRDNCLNCGAYEGVALEKPLVLSDTQVIRAYFDQGVVYTKADHHSIALAIRELMASSSSYQGQAAALKARLLTSWALKQQQLEETISRL